MDNLSGIFIYLYQHLFSRETLAQSYCTKQFVHLIGELDYNLSYYNMLEVVCITVAGIMGSSKIEIMLNTLGLAQQGLYKFSCFSLVFFFFFLARLTFLRCKRIFSFLCLENLRGPSHHYFMFNATLKTESLKGTDYLLFVFVSLEPDTITGT